MCPAYTDTVVKGQKFTVTPDCYESSRSPHNTKLSNWKIPTYARSSVTSWSLGGHIYRRDYKICHGS